MAFGDRSKLILKILEKAILHATEILEKINAKGFAITKITLNRDLKNLESANLIIREGKGKASRYKLSSKYKLLRTIDFADYFSVDSDDRKIQENFDFEIFSNLFGVISEQEKNQLEGL
jgi:arginine repressor